MMTREEFEDKLYNKDFTEQELFDLKWFDLDMEEDIYNDLKSITEEVDSDFDRWTAPASFIFSYKGEYFRLDYDKGLTELQEDYFNYQPVKVKKVEKTITITEWEEDN